MTTTLLNHGFENYIKEAIFLTLKHGHPSDCNAKTVKTTMKLVKILKRKFQREAKRQLRFYRFYHKSLIVLAKLNKDLQLAHRHYKNNEPDNAYQYVQWARIRHYDIRVKF